MAQKLVPWCLRQTEHSKRPGGGREEGSSGLIDSVTLCVFVKGGERLLLSCLMLGMDELLGLMIL